jgi:hypothetical protein
MSDEMGPKEEIKDKMDVLKEYISVLRITSPEG